MRKLETGQGSPHRFALRPPRPDSLRTWSEPCISVLSWSSGRQCRDVEFSKKKAACREVLRSLNKKDRSPSEREPACEKEKRPSLLLAAAPITRASGKDLVGPDHLAIPRTGNQ